VARVPLARGAAANAAVGALVPPVGFVLRPAAGVVAPAAGVTRSAAADVLTGEAIGGLVQRAEQLPGDLTDEARLRQLWTNDTSFDQHVKRRIAYGHATSAAHLAELTFAALARAQSAQVALGEYPVTAVESPGWATLLTQDGRIKTAYPIEPDRPSFTDNQRRLGYTVNESALTERSVQNLARVFGPH